VTLVHDALLYRDLGELAVETRTFVEIGLAAEEPVMVAAPALHVALLRGALGASAEAVRFADMERVGGNPARIIPFVHEWLDDHGGRRARFVGEPIWTDRADCARVEGERHEALLNLAFADAPVSILCPYDVAGLPDDVLTGAGHTHPGLISDGSWRASETYADPLAVYGADERPLPEPRVPVDELELTDDLTAARRFVREHARAAELDDVRLGDLLIAVNEAATNALVHGCAPVALRVWRDDVELVCEIADGGCITDPLAGRRRPDCRRLHGRGLWMINQLCDLVELRSAPTGTTLRLHMGLA
jgi:anti-sigma regulatory factor (Ser/Thr protein kinase)